jgi:regulator of protease activity HflC (stomatin/prohibitin superfamily)
MDTKKLKLIAFLVVGIVGLFTLISLGRGLVGTNNAGFYQVKQAAITGTMTVIDNPGSYMRLFADVTTYHISDMYYFSKSDLDGGGGHEAEPINVRFQGGGTASINGGIKFRLPVGDDQRLKIHQDFKSYNVLKHDLVRQVVAEALAQTATLMKAEESYSTRRAEFTALVEEQVKNGIYETETQQYKVKDSEGNELVEHQVLIKRNANGTPVIRKASPFTSYGIDIVSFQLKDFDFDQNITQLIHQKQDAEQKKVVARANAEKAQQDAITARAQGEAQIAIERATQEVEKIKQVTIAQKEFEVAKLRRAQAEQDAQAVITNGKAAAEVNKLKVQAGLTPLERATIDKETAIGVAAELAKVQFPGMMVLGGGGSGGNAGMNPFEALGLESMLRLSQQVGKSSSKSSK